MFTKPVGEAENIYKLRRAVFCVFKNKVRNGLILWNTYGTEHAQEACPFWIKKYDYHLPALIPASGLIRCVQRAISPHSQTPKLKGFLMNAGAEVTVISIVK